MTDQSIARPIPGDLGLRRGGLKDEDFARADPFIREALSENKRSGLLLAVRARWVALSITAVVLPFLNPAWNVLYYEVLLGVFALIGWAMLHAGSVVRSRREVLLILIDLALLTFAMVYPNPFRSEEIPAAYQYHLMEFSYFYILLAAAAMAYSWRTVATYGLWLGVFWGIALTLVITFGTEIPVLSEKARAVFADHWTILHTIDPNNPRVPDRIQEVIIFAIVAGILALNGWRNNRLVIRQANIARERANLARHFPPTLVDDMAERDQPLGAVRSQDVAVMFVDIVGFTRMAEQRSPEDVVALLRSFHARLEARVFEYRGTLDKFLGDGLMATFGTPETNPADAANALRCGRAMLADIAAWNGERAKAGDDPVHVSIGVHYGPVVLGDIGSERRLEYAVLGDTVNVASRLEALTRDLGVGMVASGDLVRAIRQFAEGDEPSMLSDFREAGTQVLRGRDEPIAVWTTSA